MTKRALAYILFLGIVSRVCFCQTICNCPDINDLTSEPQLSGELYTSSSFQPDIVTWFNREWLRGDIFLKDGGILRNKNIRYNSMLDELFCLEPESNQILKLDKEAIQQFHFYNFQGDTSVYFKKFRIKKDLSVDSADVFVQELYHGNLSLYIIRSFYFDHREVVRINNNYILKDIYKEEPVYYLQYSTDKIIELKVFTRKSLFALFPQKKDQVRNFFRQISTFRIKSEPELKRLMEVLDTAI
jgi:hypothetical protein